MNVKIDIDCWTKIKLYFQISMDRTRVIFVKLKVVVSSSTDNWMVWPNHYLSICYWNFLWIISPKYKYIYVYVQYTDTSRTRRMHSEITLNQRQNYSFMAEVFIPGTSTSNLSSNLHKISKWGKRWNHHIQTECFMQWKMICKCTVLPLSM